MASSRPRSRWPVPLSVALVVIAAGILPHGTRAAAPPDQLASGGGRVMPSATTYAIFWLPTGSNYEPSGVGTGSDSSYESLVQRFLTDVGGTGFVNILSQYPDSTGAAPSSASPGGSYVDTTAYPHPGTASSPLLDGDIQAAVSRAMAAKGWTSGLSSLFLVYTGYGVQSCLDAPAGQCSTDTYCAYHSWFVPGGGSQPALYAVLPDAGGNGGTCLAQGTANTSYPNGDAVADSEVSLTSKEFFAAASDPQGDGWTDSTGAEIGDKCDWDFGTIQPNGSNVTLGNGHSYLVQREWSNGVAGCDLSFLPANRLTPTPTPAGAATPTPTPVPGISRRPGPLLVSRSEVRAARALRGRARLASRRLQGLRLITGKRKPALRGLGRDTVRRGR